VARNPLIGAWRLVLLELRSNGEVVYPVGRDAVGLLIYGPEGHLSQQLMRPGRAPFASGDQLAGTPEEIRTAFEGYLAYGGTYDVDEAHATVTHNLTCCLFPKWMGTSRKHHYKLSGSRLILSPPTLLVAGHLLDALLIWERLPPA